MDTVKFVRDGQLESLRADISANIKKYEGSESWMNSYFQGAPWFLESSHKIHSFELRMPDGNNLYDIENTEIIYSALQNIPLAHAADERLWVYLTHADCWEYMVKRWNPGSKKKKNDFIRERFFFMPNKSRAIVRNGLARLWWYGYLTYDETRDDPYELTKHMLGKLDIAQSLLERTISHVPAVTRGVLEVLDERVKVERPFDDREEFRDLMKYLNHKAGVTILDVLDKSDIKDIVRSSIEGIEAKKEQGRLIM